MKNMGIYKIINLINNHCYIGSSINLNKRKVEHFKGYNKKSNPILQNAIKKYSIDNFKFEILELIDNKEMLIPIEQKYIDKIKPEYNICKKAGSLLGFKHSIESKLKMSKSVIKRFKNKKIFLCIINIIRKKQKEKLV